MRLTIDQHISSLLFYHECVVLPGFGAFITRYYPAEVQSATSMFRPPSKRVAFNGRIKDNDGLLAKQVARLEKVSYEHALKEIKISVRHWERILKSGKKINLNGVGRLFIDEAGLLQFTPSHEINYHLQSYGLNIFRASAMEREQKIKRSVNRAIENHKEKKPQEPKSSKRKQWVWAAILGPAVAILLVGTYYYTQERDKFDEAAGMVTGIFDTDSRGEAETKSDTSAEGAAIVGGAKEAPAGTEDENYQDRGDNAEESLYDVKEKPIAPEDRNKTELSEEEEIGADYVREEKTENPERERSTYSRSAASSQGNYEIVVGSFSEERNADKLVQNLKAQGYSAYRAGQFGLYNRVAIGKYGNEQEARSALSRIRSELNAQAWLKAK